MTELYISLMVVQIGLLGTILWVLTRPRMGATNSEQDNSEQERFYRERRIQMEFARERAQKRTTKTVKMCKQINFRESKKKYHQFHTTEECPQHNTNKTREKLIKEFKARGVSKYSINNHRIED